MIELAIKKSVERITGMKLYPLLLPADVYNGGTYLRVSDPEIMAGMVRTGLTAGRFQITLYTENDFTKLVKQDKAIWAEWRHVVHGEIEGYPVQYVRRDSISHGKETLNSGNILYSLARDYILTFAE
ncbi:hypothetical protein KOEU_37800 [Komagataeibacter europaeus]|uniref:Uncharacterized protein n=1 Tax=Komagataeibacter europaeus TaxID=33995 RepID=A0A0M0EBS5_KOMEU|nr:hypothetical protein [Komagataeibacter europaeus]KON62732.1 hypothetical protein KOEU_37800 [Komagataeibacter europaeus]